MRVDYRREFPAGLRAMAELERAGHSVTLEPELDLPDGAAGPRSASGSA